MISDPNRNFYPESRRAARENLQQTTFCFALSFATTKEGDLATLTYQRSGLKIPWPLRELLITSRVHSNKGAFCDSHIRAQPITVACVEKFLFSTPLNRTGTVVLNFCCQTCSERLSQPSCMWAGYPDLAWAAVLARAGREGPP